VTARIQKGRVPSVCLSQACAVLLGGRRVFDIDTPVQLMECHQDTPLQVAAITRHPFVCGNRELRGIVRHLAEEVCLVLVRQTSVAQNLFWSHL
jgi:hypothetical protein